MTLVLSAVITGLLSLVAVLIGGLVSRDPVKHMASQVELIKALPDDLPTVKNDLHKALIWQASRYRNRIQNVHEARAFWLRAGLLGFTGYVGFAVVAVVALNEESFPLWVLLPLVAYLTGAQGLFMLYVYRRLTGRE